MMMGSWEANVSYETPLGVAHQFRSSDHYGPMPSEWFQRDDWSPVYYNKADSAGLGFNRSPTGSNLVGQYFSPLKERYSSIDTTPENLLMWFHHVPWDRTMSSGRPFWDELVYRYQMGVQYVTWMRETWDTLQPVVGARRLAEVRAKLGSTRPTRRSWRDTSVNYWREFSGRPNPVDGGPLSLAVTVGGKERRRVRPVGARVHGPRRRGRAAITAVRTLDPGARARSCRRRRAPGQAIVKVTKTDFFGPAREELRVQHRAGHDVAQPARERQAAGVCKPAVTSYNALSSRRARRGRRVEAVASDPAATVSVERRAARPGRPVTVTNGSASTVYTVNLDMTNAGSDEFDSARSQWQILRPDDAPRRVAGGSLRDHLAERRPPGHDEHREEPRAPGRQRRLDGGVKLVFSRPLANNNEQGGIIAYNSDQNYVKLAWEMSSVTQAINKLRVVVIREQNGTATTLQVTGADAQKLVGADGAIWLRLAKAAARTRRTTPATAASGGTLARRRSTSSRRRPAWWRSTAAGPRPISTSRSTTSASPAAATRCRRWRPRPRAASAATSRRRSSLTLGAGGDVRRRSRPAWPRTT